MKIEVNSAAEFLMNLLRVRQKIAVTDSQLESFRGQLADQLTQRYQRHWYPEMPHKGSGYRCIRINGKMDPLVEQAGVAAGLPTRTLKKLLPPELTMWIDPDEVCYRIGENGSICVLYDTSRASPTSDVDSTGSNGSDEYVMERVSRRINISNDLKDLMMNLYEADTTFVTRPKSHRNRNRRFQQQQQQSSHNKNFHHNLNNSVSSTTSTISPPLSPNHHQQSVFYQQQQQQMHFMQQQQQFGSSPQKQFNYNFNNYHHGNNSVQKNLRAPC